LQSGGSAADINATYAEAAAAAPVLPTTTTTSTTTSTTMNVVALTNQIIGSVGPFGGSSGVNWDDNSQIIQARGQNKFINKIDYRAGATLDSIQLYYTTSDGRNEETTGNKGGSEGNVSKVSVFTSQPRYITGIRLRSGAKIDSITLFFSDGTVSERIGGDGGNETFVQMPAGYALVGVNGSTGATIESLSFLWQRIDRSGLNNFTGGVGEVGPFGGDGGEYFDDGQGGEDNFTIDIRSGAALDSIKFGGYGSKRGGDGGNPYSFSVGSGEYITGVSLRTGAWIDGIQFTTSNGRRSDWCGGQGGNPCNITLPDGLAIVGIKGRSGSLVNQLAFRIKVVS